MILQAIISVSCSFPFPTRVLWGLHVQMCHHILQISRLLQKVGWFLLSLLPILLSYHVSYLSKWLISCIVSFPYLFEDIWWKEFGRGSLEPRLNSCVDFLQFHVVWKYWDACFENALSNIWNIICLFYWQIHLYGCSLNALIVFFIAHVLIELVYMWLKLLSLCC